MLEVDLHSRSRLAGYEPEILFNTTVLIVGAGALGQNLALNLALAGIGELNIVDFDVFEAHNATRSPLYPTAEEQLRWGIEKAKVAAHKLLPMMTAPSAKVRYAVAPIQALGDFPMARAQIVYAAVDNPGARAYLAERCRNVRRPLIEAGFHAETMNLSIFGPDTDEPCYRCLNPEKVGAYSCTRYALQVEEMQAIPAIQNTAAVLAGLQAEVGIQWLHGEQTLRNKRVYANIRTMSMSTIHLARSLQCPGVHWQSVNPSPIVLEVGGDDPLEHLLKAVAKEVGPAQIRFPEPLVMCNFCTRCNGVTDAHTPEWRWLVSPRCLNCEGPFSPALNGRQVGSRAGVHTNEEDEVTRLTCAEVGLPAGATFEVWPDTYRFEPDERYLMQVKGTIDQLMRELSNARVS